MYLEDVYFYTQYLTEEDQKAEKPSIAFDFYVEEIDKNLLPPLTAICEMHDNIELINEDILKLNVHEIVARKLAESQGAEIQDSMAEDNCGEHVVYRAKTPENLKNVKIVANLPYYITTPIIFNFLENKIPELESMTFMVQKEVAKRMTASPGGKDYGALTVTVGYFSEAEIDFIVPPHCFIPQPNVDSAVITLKIRNLRLKVYATTVAVNFRFVRTMLPKQFLTDLMFITSRPSPLKSIMQHRVSFLPLKDRIRWRIPPLSFFAHWRISL